MNINRCFRARVEVVGKAASVCALINKHGAWAISVDGIIIEIGCFIEQLLRFLGNIVVKMSDRQSNRGCAA